MKVLHKKKLEVHICMACLWLQWTQGIKIICPFRVVKK